MTDGVTDNRIIFGDALTELQNLPGESVQCCVTSPPYWGLRDYGVDSQLGLEKTPEEYVVNMVDIFRQVRRVLREDGTLWLNLGDSYNGSGGAGGDYNDGGLKAGQPKYPGRHVSSLKVKDLCMMPARVALALQADGWWLRQDIIWHKPNTMPESVTDRCTKAHEYIFLLTKSAKYYYDADAIADPLAPDSDMKYRQRLRSNKEYNTKVPYLKNTPYVKYKKGQGRVRSRDDCAPQNHLCVGGNTDSRNKRSVWTINTKPYPEAHFAVFPHQIPANCIKAGSRTGDVILDPFLGSGTTAQVAKKLGRRYLGIELNVTYKGMIERRLAQGELFNSGDNDAADMA